MAKMNVGSELIRRTRQNPMDLEDLASNWVEEELGRYDWIANWAKAKERGNIRERIDEWLKLMNVQDVSPESIIQYIDELVKSRTGRWG